MWPFDSHHIPINLLEKGPISFNKARSLCKVLNKLSVLSVWLPLWIMFGLLSYRYQCLYKASVVLFAILRYSISLGGGRGMLLGVRLKIRTAENGISFWVCGGLSLRKVFFSFWNFKWPKSFEHHIIMCQSIKLHPFVCAAHVSNFREALSRAFTVAVHFLSTKIIIANTPLRMYIFRCQVIKA